LLAGQFQDQRGTIADVMEHVQSGHALCAGLLNGKWRSKSNITGSQWVLIDIDNSKGLTNTDGNPLDDQGRLIRIGRQSLDVHGNPIDKPDGRKQAKIYDHQLTIDEAIAHPFIAQHCALIYTSASHKPDWHKFRLVFLLPEQVEGSDTIEALVLYLMEQLPHDPACKDSSRVFYGNTNAEFPLVNPIATLPPDWIEQAKAAAEVARAEHERRLTEAIARREQLQQTALEQGWNFDALVEEALSYIPPRQLGSGNYDECRQVLMALHSHYGAAAEAIAENWSPSIPGTTWNLAQKFKSFKRSDGIGIGTLFHIARQFGFKFPTVEPSDPADEDFLAWLTEQEKVAEAQAETQADEDFLNKVLRYFGGSKRKRKTRQRVQVERSVSVHDLGAYEPGRVPELCKSEESFKIWYQPGDEAELYREAIAHGYHILDTSPTGSGKTQRAGQLHPQNFVFEMDGQTIEPTLIYLGADHRNPKTASVEKNFADVPNRHAGMVIDKNRQTALGKDYIVNPKSEHGPEIERLPGNCHRAAEFAIARQKGLTWASETATSNPICQSCAYFGTCGDPNSDHLPGSGFRALRSEALKASRIRMSPDQYPRNWDSDRTINIWDEAAQTIAVSESLTVTLNDFDGAWATLEVEAPELHKKLATLRRELRRLLTGKQPHHGFSRDEIISSIGQVDLSLDEIERIREATAPYLVDLFGAIDSVDFSELSRQITNLRARIDRKVAKGESFQQAIKQVEADLKERSPGVLFGGVDERSLKLQSDDLKIQLKALESEVKFLRTDLTELEKERVSLRSVSRKVQHIDRKRQSEALENTFVCWLAPLVEIVLSITVGTLSIQHGKLLIHLAKEQHRRIIHEALANIFLDATASTESIAFRTRIPVERILVCEAIHDGGAIVHHVQVKDFGLAGKKRAESTDARIVAAIDGIKSQHDGCNPVEFDHLNKSSRTGAKGVHFRDSRGENSFMQHDVFVHVGLPMPNIGAVRIEHEILSQSSEKPPNFDQYYQSVCDAELLQEMGRDRALRRGGSIFHYWVTDIELPFTATQMKAAELSVDAASQAEKTQMGLCNAIAQLTKSGGKITQEAIADVAEITQGWVSKFFARIGGWRKWRKIITGLLNSSNRASNNLESALEGLTDDALWIAEVWLKELVEAFAENPLGVVDAMGAIVESYGFSTWEKMLALCDRTVVAQLLGQMSLFMPEWMFQGCLQEVLPGE
jgi:hypothetical protein